MAHNALVLASITLPAGGADRRRLGLARSRSGDPARSFHLVRLEDVPPGTAVAIGRILATCGGAAEAEPAGRNRGRVLWLSGTAAAFAALARRLGGPGGGRTGRAGAAARAAALEVREAILAVDCRPRHVGLRRGRLDLSGGPLVMGILNVTPDSFSDGGRFQRVRSAVGRALRMADEGATILDIGGESTRPGSSPVGLDEELRRVLPVLDRLVPALDRRRQDRPILSIDTTKAEVARRAAAAGAGLINDISGLTFDPAMASVVAATGLPVVLSHIRKRPRTMGRPPRYRHLIPEIARFLRASIERATRAGVRPDRIILDPGIGFGKGRRDNLAILRHLAVLRSLGKPILVGASRKSFIGGTLELPVEDRLEGSLAAEALAVAGGADIIRAHDVRPAVRVAILSSAVLRGRPGDR